MLHLLLLRHAEAETGPGVSDMERSLTERGRLEAMHAARCIAQADLTIDSIVVSPARRTRETAVIVITQLNLSVPPLYEADLYLAAADILLRSVRGCRAEARTVLLVAHNPGISDLVHRLSGDERAPALKTGGLRHMTFVQSTWGDIGTAQTVAELG